MERQVGDGEDCENYDHQVDGFLSQGGVVHVVADQCLDDHAVATEYDNEWDAEPKHSQNHAVNEITRQLVLGGRVITGGRITFWTSPRVIENWGHAYNDYQPHQRTRDYCILLLQPA